MNLEFKPEVLSKEYIASDATQIISNATLYNFGILTSNVHMAWMRTVAGRLEMRYRYSAKIVYNNFPWCNPSEEQKRNLQKKGEEMGTKLLFPMMIMLLIVMIFIMVPALFSFQM